MTDLLTIARRFLADLGREKEEKTEKGVAGGGFSPFPSFSSPPVAVFSPSLLVGSEPWDQREAVRLRVEADSLVARLAMDGQLPAIVKAAEMVGSAFATRDMETVRFACAEFAFVVRGLASPSRLKEANR